MIGPNNIQFENWNRFITWSDAKRGVKPIKSLMEFEMGNLKRTRQLTAGAEAGRRFEAELRP